MRLPLGERCRGALDGLRDARGVAAVIERELDELGEHRLFDHEQRARRAAQPVLVGGHARMRFDVSLLRIPWTRKNSTAIDGGRGANSVSRSTEKTPGPPGDRVWSPGQSNNPAPFKATGDRRPLFKRRLRMRARCVSPRNASGGRPCFFRPGREV
jgi:hypothetical protein